MNQKRSKNIIVTKQHIKTFFQSLHSVLLTLSFPHHVNVPIHAMNKFCFFYQLCTTSFVLFDLIFIITTNMVVMAATSS